jgi:hypothetical protein
MNTKYVYGLVALVTACLFMVPAFALDSLNTHKPVDKFQVNRSDEMLFDGSIDWMFLLDKASLDNLQKMTPEDIDRLKQEMTQKLNGMPLENVDVLRKNNFQGLRNILKNMPPAEIERLRMKNLQKDGSEDGKMGDFRPRDDRFKDNKFNESRIDDTMDKNMIPPDNRGIGPFHGANSFNNQPTAPMGPR